MNATRLIIICCEGKTEQKYFEIIKDVFRGPYYLDVDIYGEKGQHMALIDYAARTQEDRIKKDGFERDEVSTWAVCDDDGMSFSYNELYKYAESKRINLAFSRPQFEVYLIQHFEQSKECNQQALFFRLSQLRKQYGSKGNYNDSTKADLEWLERAIRDKPKLVDIAIVNSNIRKSQSANPFITVQALVKHLQALEVK